MADPRSRGEEARRLARYLAAVDLDARAVGHYDRWHTHVGPAADGDRVDRMLVGLACCCEIGAALADAYTARIRRAGLLRKKLVLLLALIETSDGEGALDRPVASSPLGFWARMVGRGLGAVFMTLIALLLIGPCHVVCAVLPGGKGAS